MLGIRCIGTGKATSVKKCDECGCRINIGDEYIHWNNHYYCSNGCRDKADFRDLKARGEARLQKWEREVEKKNANIARLRRALAANSAGDISLAIHGGFWGWIKKILKFILILPSIVFWIGIAIIAFKVVTESVNSNQSEESEPPTVNIVSEETAETTTTNIVTENTTEPTATNIVTKTASTPDSIDLVAEYESVSKEVIDCALEANPERNDKLTEAHKKNIEAFKSSSLEEQKEKLQKMKARLQSMKKSSTTNK